MLLAGLGVRYEKARFHIVAFAFLEDLVGAILVFILHVENGIDQVLTLQNPEAILPSEAREYGAVVKSGLAVQIKLRGPPGRCSVLKLGPEGMEIVAASLSANGGEIFDLQVAGFFEIVVISDEVRVLLGEDRDCREN
jgi:hypothetical protein